VGRLLVPPHERVSTGTAQKWLRQTPGPKVVPSPESQPRDEGDRKGSSRTMV